MGIAEVGMYGSCCFVGSTALEVEVKVICRGGVDGYTRSWSAE